MVFSSMVFLCIFLPVVFLLHLILPGIRAKNWMLLLASLVFYAYGEPVYVLLMIASAFVNYLSALLIEKKPSGKKAVMTINVILNLGVLVLFKYTGFLAESFNAIFGTAVPVPAIRLPIGISFFTFQAMAYLTDVYRGTIPAERSLPRLTLFMAFFPQLLQGPILRYGEFAPALTQRQENSEDAAAGATRFCFGLAKKVLLADSLGVIADAAFSSGDRLTMSLAWLGGIAYTLQLYFDFSGYTDMAIGLGRIFGFRLPENFNYPYISKSASEFWRRWHMTLSFWFRDYVYIPLGGNRCSRGRQILNLMAVWMLTGLWHGSAWNFVLWGLYYALLLMGEKFLWGKFLEKLPAAVRHVYALVLIIIGWVLFRSGSLAQVGQMVAAMFGAAPGGLWQPETAYYLHQFRWELLLAIPASLPVKQALEERLAVRKGKGAQALLILGPKVLGFGLLGWSVVRLLSSTFRSFLYFQF